MYRPGPHVAREEPIRATEDTGVVRQAWQDARGPGARGDFETRGERQRALVEALRAEHVIAEGTLGVIRRADAQGLSQGHPAERTGGRDGRLFTSARAAPRGVVLHRQLGPVSNNRAQSARTAL